MIVIIGQVWVIVQKNMSTLAKNYKKACAKILMSHCDYWKNLGHCEGEYGDYMAKNCKKSCGICWRLSILPMKTEGVGVFYFYLKSCFSKFVLLKINFFLFYLTLAYSYCTTVRLGQNLVFKAKCILGETTQCVKKVKILSCS